MTYLRCLMLLAATWCCYAGPIGIDGIFGPEWAGITPTFIPHIAGTPEGNFQLPSPGTDAVAYDIFLRSDGAFVYGFFQSLPGLGGTAVGNFVNIYFATNPSVQSSTLGFELGGPNPDAFIPGVSGSNNFGVSQFLTLATSSSPDALEFALPVSFFTTNPLGMAFPVSTEGRIVLRLSQSFGLSVAGGDSFGPDRLGSVSLAAVQSTPEPYTLPLLGLGLLALAGYRRHK
jgi:PEP-CTERM motif